MARCWRLPSIKGRLSLQGFLKGWEGIPNWKNRSWGDSRLFNVVFKCSTWSHVESLLYTPGNTGLDQRPSGAEGKKDIMREKADSRCGTRAAPEVHAKCLVFTWHAGKSLQVDASLRRKLWLWYKRYCTEKRWKLRYQLIWEKPRVLTRIVGEGMDNRWCSPVVPHPSTPHGYLYVSPYCSILSMSQVIITAFHQI